MQPGTNYLQLGSKAQTKLGRITAYRKNMYLERLLEKGLITLEDLKGIRNEIRGGLEFSADRGDKRQAFPAREECAVALANENVQTLIQNITAIKQGKDAQSCDIHLLGGGFFIYTLVGTFGAGKETLARGIARKLNMNQMCVPAASLIDETPYGTGFNVSDLFREFSSRSNTALILSDADCLLAGPGNKQVNPDSILADIRRKQKESQKNINNNNNNNILICTVQDPRNIARELDYLINKFIQIDLPNAEQRFEILKVMFSDRAQLDEAAIEKLRVLAQKLDNHSPRQLQGVVNEVMSGAVYDQVMVEHDHSNTLPRVTAAHLQESLIYLALKLHDGPTERLDRIKLTLSFHCKLAEGADRKLEEVIQRTMNQPKDYLFTLGSKIVHNDRMKKALARRAAANEKAGEGVFVTSEDIENAYNGVAYDLPDLPK